MNYFTYGQEEIDYLSARDPILGSAIEKMGIVKRETNPQVFSALIEAIVGQQISTKAADTVRARLQNMVGDFTPENLDKYSLEEIASCGMSNRKAEYIKGIGEAALKKHVDFDKLDSLNDQEIVDQLTTLRGVGEWTAEMLLFHAFQRPDILSFKDLGIRRGIITLYGLDELTREVFENYRKIYSPHGSVASIYLWAIWEGQS